MHINESLTPNAEVTRELSPVIFDVDGLLLASSHERAWREALDDPREKARFNTRMYQSQVAGRPRLSGALAGPVGIGSAQCRTLRVRPCAGKAAAPRASD